jgi:arylsulfatase A
MRLMALFYCASLALFSCAFPSLSCPFLEAATLPNIVLILADDMGVGDPGCYNPQSKIPTPNIDRLAREGLRMTDMHSPSAVCTPTRYGLLTGRYCWRTRLKESVLFGYGTALIEPARPTLASLLQGHGYRTAVFGKWHLGLGEGKKTDYSKPLAPGPLTVGFDRFYGIPASLDMAPYVYVDDTRVVEAATEEIASANYIRFGGKGYIVGGKIAPSFRHIDVLPVTTDKTVEFIDRQSAEKPFFVYVPFSAPHTPWVPTERYAGKSQAGPYGDFTVMVDDCVGQILEALERKGFKENTLVIFTSDNGSHWLPQDIKQYEHRGNLDYRGQKADIHEGGHRVPFVVRWPGQIEAGVTRHQLGCLTDVFATVASVIGKPLAWEEGEDSFSLLPLWQQDKAVRNAIVHHSGRGMFAIRRGDWKLILGLGTGGFTEPWGKIEPKEGEPAGQLYHLGNDLAEQDNVYLQHPEVVASLSGLLEDFMRTGRSR